MSAHPVERKYREPSNGAPTGGFDGDAFYDPIGADMAAAEAQPKPITTMGEHFLGVIAGIWHKNPDYSIRQTLDALNAKWPAARPAQLDVAVNRALFRPECRRLSEWSQSGPVQRAAVESFADAMLASAPFTPDWAGYRQGLADGKAEAQPVGEPVGWLYDWTHSSATGRPDEDFTAFTPDESRARSGFGNRNVRPVYAAPPAQPAAQPLTDAQIEALVLETVYENDERIRYRDYWVSEIGMPFARAIERAHGIGSQP